jgi:hypothetical protein
MGIYLKDKPPHLHLIERKRMNKWHLKSFPRLLNTSILNVMVMYKNDTRKTINEMSFRIQLVEGL